MTAPVELANGPEIAARFKATEKAMKADLRRAHAQTARDVRGIARSAAAGGTRQQARMAAGIGSSATATSAALTIRRTPGAPGARGAFFGSKHWAQFPPWVGSGWKVGVRGEGPYVLNNALADHMSQIEANFLDGAAKAVQAVLSRRA